MKNEKKLKPFNSAIQVCSFCHKVDVSKGHEKDCNPEYEAYRQEANEHFWK